jgi:tetratricopeptide (TPR) repeat protein
MAVLILAAAMIACSAGRDRALPHVLRAVELHREASAHAAAGKIEDAVRALERVAEIVLPDDAPERDDVRVDAFAEIARLYLAAKRPVDAERAAKRAISMSREPSYFVGLAWLRLGDALGAQRRVRASAAAYEQSIAVNRVTLERITREGAPR